MRVRCSNPNCSQTINFRKGFVQQDCRVFCSEHCRKEWWEQNDLFKHAAEGKMTVNGKQVLGSRRPKSKPKWYDVDG